MSQCLLFCYHRKPGRDIIINIYSSPGSGRIGVLARQITPGHFGDHAEGYLSHVLECQVSCLLSSSPWLMVENAETPVIDASNQIHICQAAAVT